MLPAVDEEIMDIPDVEKRVKEVVDYGELPEDLKEVISIIQQNGGRITQKELRKKLSLSEAKISLMITDLENRGLVTKIKKGRGNVIILTNDRKL
ncbi:MAG: helix-turn-helix transcriptional regulator [Candidatus Syntropharchaeia archaeon]